jgi:hypothetical protein
VRIDYTAGRCLKTSAAEVSNSEQILRLFEVEAHMNKILTSIALGSLLGTLAMAQSSRSVMAGRRGCHVGAWPGGRLSAYVITGTPQFGALDLRTGIFCPIGPGLPTDVGGGLVPGRDDSLLTLAFSGTLDAINLMTGATTVLGSTGLGDCSTPTSPCGPDSALVIGRHGENLYATDFAQNLYSLDPLSGTTRLIGHTGIPELGFTPFSPNSGCQNCVNVYGASLFSARGKFYAYFATAVLDLDTGIPISNPIPGALYQINPKTAEVMQVVPTDSEPYGARKCERYPLRFRCGFAAGGKYRPGDRADRCRKRSGSTSWSGCDWGSSPGPS